MDPMPLVRHLNGAPPALPSHLDRLSEHWWRLPPRGRAGVLTAFLLVVLAAGIGRSASSPWGPPVTVHVAARDLGVGDVVADDDLHRRGWPRDLVPADAVAGD